MVTNESMSLIKRDKFIEYNDGVRKELYSDNIAALWELLNIFTKKDVVNVLKEWRAQHGYSEEDLDDIIDYLRDNRFLIMDDEVINKSHPERRYYNFFNTYSFGIKDYKRIKDLNVLIIGAGTVGSTLCSMLSKYNVANIYIIDKDTVESHNINSQFIFTKTDIGLSKVDVIANKINNDESSTKITAITSEIDDSNLEIIKNLIVQNDIDFVYSCFDGAEESVHQTIFEYCLDFHVPYILNGYTGSTVSSIFLMGQEDKEYLEKLFKDSFSFISNNKGLIVHSSISATLCVEHLLAFISYGTSIKKREYTFSYPLQPKNHLPDLEFIDEEDVLQELKHIKHNIGSTKQIAEIENQIVSLHRVSEIMNAFPELYLSLEKINSELESIIKMLSDEDENHLEELIHHYQFVKEGIKDIEELFELLERINFEPNYEERLKMQNKIYQTIYRESDKLLGAILAIKQEYIDQNYYENEYEQIHGINAQHIETFEKRMIINYEVLGQGIWRRLFPNTLNDYDYLFYLSKDYEVNINKTKSIDLLISVMKDLSAKNRMGINFKRHIKALDRDNLVIEQEKVGATSFYFPEHNQTVIKMKTISSLYDFQLLIHEIGHSYFNRYYKTDFYSKSNVFLNETLAHFTEILTGRLIMSTNHLNDVELDAFRFQYMYRLNQFIISSFATYSSESRLIDEIKEGRPIDINRFIEIHRDEDNLLPNTRFKNSEFSKLNVLIYSPFAVGFLDTIQKSIAFSFAIHLYESYKGDLDTLDYRLKELFLKNEITIEEVCESLFGQSYDENLISKVLKSVELHLNDL